MVAPHTGHVFPVRPWTRSRRFFAALIFPGGSSINASRARPSTSRTVSSSAGASTPEAGANGESLAAWRISSE